MRYIVVSKYQMEYKSEPLRNCSESGRSSTPTWACTLAWWPCCATASDWCPQCGRCSRGFSTSPRTTPGRPGWRSSPSSPTSPSPSQPPSPPTSSLSSTGQTGTNTNKRIWRWRFVRPKKSKFTNLKKNHLSNIFCHLQRKNLSLQLNQRITLHKKVNYCPSLHFLKRNHQIIFCKEINRKLFPTF